MKKLLLGIVALAAASAAPAVAADMPIKARPVVAAFSWQGCYFGIQGGANWGRSRHDGFPPGPIEITPYFNLSGGEAGIEYGCNYALGGGWVFGTESDFSWTNKRGSSFDTGPGGVPTFESTTRERWFSTTRIRLGMGWDRTLLYVTGGLALARVEATLNTHLVGFPIFTESRTLWGGTIGAGLEQIIAPNWSIKAEYLFMSFANKDYRFGNDPLVGPQGINAQRSGVNLSDHVFRLGINYRFAECLLFCGAVVAKY